MTLRIFLAGAAGAVGRRLVPLLVDNGHHVIGTTRSASKADALATMGIEPVVVDVFDESKLAQAVLNARPDVVIHQLTDLPAGLEPSRMPEALGRNAKLREEGTRNLVRAAHLAGVPRMVAQSIGWAYAAGPEPQREEDPLDLGASGDRGVSVRGVSALEKLTLNSPPLVGVVLRYGHLYGVGTGIDLRPASMPLHVDAAAFAALLALGPTEHDVYNIAEPNAQISSARAVSDLGWRDDFRLLDTAA